MKYSAIIPVRAGSKRLPNKNILPFGNSNLLIHKIRQLKKVPMIGEIVVSSDSSEMLQMACEEGVSIHKRPIEYADEKTKSFGEVVSYCAEYGARGKNVIWAPCVCPLCDENDFAGAIRTYEEEVLSGEYDSVISVKSFKEYLWDDRGPVNYKAGLGHVPSQQLPDWKVIVNGFYVASREDMVKWSYFFGHRPYMLTLPKHKAVDIDDQQDFAFAEFLYNRTDSSEPHGGKQHTIKG